MAQNISNGKRQVVKELFRNARKNFNRRKTDMIGINDTYQIDLVEMNNVFCALYIFIKIRFR